LFLRHRLEFDTWGRLKNLKQGQIKMLTLVFFLVKVLLINVLSKPWAHGVCEASKNCKLVFKIFCSCIVLSIQDWVAKRAKLVPGNDFHLDKNSKVAVRGTAQIDETLKMKKWIPRRVNDEQPVFLDGIERPYLEEFLKTYGEMLEGVYDGFADAYYLEIFSSDD
jgi:hypothetical protein